MTSDSVNMAIINLIVKSVVGRKFVNMAIDGLFAKNVVVHRFANIVFISLFVECVVDPHIVVIISLNNHVKSVVDQNTANMINERLDVRNAAVTSYVKPTAVTHKLVKNMMVIVHDVRFI